MTTHSSAFRKGLAKVFGVPLLSIFVIPLVSWLFVQHALPEHDARVLQAIESNIDRDTALDEAGKDAARAFFRGLPASRMCDNRDPQLQEYRDKVCAPYSEAWQFTLVRQVSLWSMVAGVTVLLAAVALGALAFVNRRARHLSFLVGWRLLTAASAIGVTVYAALLVWLSFWVFAFFFHRYYVNVILIVGLLAASLVVITVVGIFRRPPQDAGIAGEALGFNDAPALWAHLREVAARMGTRAPDYVVAGIDTNFFVTESPLRVDDRTFEGRSLFVSLPLLRILDRAEADAVLAHELAHLRGGDAATSAALGPLLVRYDHYSRMMASNKLTLFVHHLLHLYRTIFEFALRRESRSREFQADRVAAELVSAPAMVRALIKTAAYACYRVEIEQVLFGQDQRHEGPLDIGRRVASGLAPYAASQRFREVMKSASVPHPFDSHPPLQERMANVGQRIDEQEFGAIVGSVPAQSWASDIDTAEDIERRLWARYEQQFAQAHERDLACRYQPANAAELAIVLKHFPPVGFPLERGQRIEVSHVGLTLPGAAQVLSWDSVADLRYEHGIATDVLHIVRCDGHGAGEKSSPVKLPGIAAHSATLKTVLGRYWQRHKLMRQYQARSRSSP